MSQKVLFIKLLLVHYATQSQTDIQADCNEDVSLKCPDTDSMNFLSVTWYKVNNQEKNGIIRRGNGENSTQRYKFTRHTEFGEKYSLFLQSVMPEDSGTYECAISARVGFQNQNLKVNLTISACVTQADLTTMTNALNMTQGSDLLYEKHVEELPVTWSIIGYVTVGLAKIILSLISIWVIQAFRVRSSRRDQHKW